MAALGEHGNLPSLDISYIDWTFFTGSEHADDTAEGGSLLKEWQEVDDESRTRIVNKA